MITMNKSYTLVWLNVCQTLNLMLINLKTDQLRNDNRMIKMGRTWNRVYWVRLLTIEMIIFFFVMVVVVNSIDVDVDTDINLNIGIKQSQNNNIYNIFLQHSSANHMENVKINNKSLYFSTAMMIILLLFFTLWWYLYLL